jgi:hypothetical protein
MHNYLEKINIKRMWQELLLSFQKTLQMCLQTICKTNHAKESL